MTTLFTFENNRLSCDLTTGSFIAVVRLGVADDVHFETSRCKTAYRRSFDIESKLDKYLDVFSVVLSNTVFIRLEHENVVNLHVNTVSAL